MMLAVPDERSPDSQGERYHDTNDPFHIFAPYVILGDPAVETPVTTFT